MPNPEKKERNELVIKLIKRKVPYSEIMKQVNLKSKGSINSIVKTYRKRGLLPAKSL